MGLPEQAFFDLMPDALSIREDVRRGFVDFGLYMSCLPVTAERRVALFDFQDGPALGEEVLRRPGVSERVARRAQTFESHGGRCDGESVDVLFSREHPKRGVSESPGNELL